MKKEKEFQESAGYSRLTHEWKRLRSYTVFWVLLIIIIMTAFIEPSFLKVNNMINIIRQTAINGILAIGMTFVIIAGGIDLSMGATVGMVATSTAILFQYNIPVPLAVIAAIGIGGLIGCCNGIGITKGKIAPFIMTLGTMSILRGLTNYITKGSPQNWRNSNIDFKFWGQGTFLGIPVPVYIFMLVLVVTAYILKYTPFGRGVYAIGDSREAARLNGINTQRVELKVFIMSGVLSALSALILISRLSSGEPTAGEGAEMDAVAMTVIGGTSILGGTGTVMGTMVGAILLSVISNALNILNISPFLQQVVKGVVIILAVLMDLRNKKNL